MVPRPVAAYDSLPGCSLRQRDEVLERGDAELRRHGEEHRLLADEADRREVARHFERQVGLQPGKRHERRGGGHVERVAVGSGGRARARRHRAAGARLVEHHDLLADERAEPVADDAQHHVGGAARRRMGDDADRLAGKTVGLGGGLPQRACQQRPHSRELQQPNSHFIPPGRFRCAIVVAGDRRGKRWGR
jgi:hypothetical protein